MPEGDVVLRTARRLNLALAGSPLVVADLRWPSLATCDLTGRPVLEVVSVGKHLLTRICGGLTLHSHLRMEGSWRVHATPADPTNDPATRGHGVRAVLATERWTCVGHRLGMLDLVPTAQEASLVGHLGPDLLGPGWDAARAVRNIAADPSRPVGEALLDQRCLAGIGTFFMAETLFLRGVSPWTPVADCPDLPAVVDLAHRLLAANAERAIQSTTGDLRPHRRAYVHARSGHPCRRCGTPIRVAAIGTAPTDRVAFYCPHCQPGPAPTDPGAPATPLGWVRPTGTRSPDGRPRRPGGAADGPARRGGYRPGR